MSGEISFAEFWELFGPAVIAALLSALVCGYLGFFVVLRRVAFVSAALGQISGLGIALGFLLGASLGIDPHQPTPLYLDPVVLALGLTAAVAVLIGYASRAQRSPPEAIIAFVYLGATSLALIVLASPLIVQESHEVGDLLFGSAVAVRPEHLAELAVVTVLVLGSQLFLYKDLVLISFDREMARALGLPVARLELLLSLSIGLTVAVATRAIGALPVFGFLVLPAGAALWVARSSAAVLGWSMVGAVVAGAGGFYLSFLLAWPTGPMMVVVAASYWPLAAAVRLVRGRG
ncbi:MAG: metal ABC transporter permease [Myxococcota bacterium]|nr:metal ABC transporter permease [Myxococcota bacterium]